MGRRKSRQIQRQEPVNHSRRNFLGWGIGSAAALAVGATRIDYFLSGDENRWAFLQNPLRRPSDSIPSYEEIKKNCAEWGNKNVPVSPEQQGELLKDAVNATNQWAISKHLNPSQFTVKVHLQNYIAPIDNVTGNSVVDYSRRSLEYMSEKIRGLKDPTFQFEIVDGKRKLSNRDRKIVIGREIFVLKTGEVYHKKTNKKIIDLGESGVHDGCMMSFDPNNPERYSVFINANPFVLRGIFSEVIPLTTLEKSLEYGGKFGHDLAVLADETIVEGISESLAKGLAEKEKVPDSEKYLGRLKDIMYGGENRHNSSYRFVPQSVAWIQRNGVQAAFDLYMESPEKFMKAIGAQ